MKYNINAKVMGFVFSKLLKKYYDENFSDIDIKKHIKATKKEYKAIIQRTPSVTKGCTLGSNLVGASYFFAIAKTIPNMTPDLMNDIVKYGFSSKIMIKMHEGKKKKGTIFSDKEQDQRVKESDMLKDSTNEMDWKFTYKKMKDEYYLTFTQCGVCRLAERENLKEYLPCMCAMDFPKYKLMGATLIRDKTLANGDECCNFHLVRDKNEKI